MKAGDRVWRILGSDSIQYAVVDKVGRKYFYIGHQKFLIDTMVEVKDYGAQTQVYATEQDARDVIDKSRIRRKLREASDIWGAQKHTADQLRRIEKILDE